MLQGNEKKTPSDLSKVQYLFIYLNKTFGGHFEESQTIVRIKINKTISTSCITKTLPPITALPLESPIFLGEMKFYELQLSV